MWGWGMGVVSFDKFMKLKHCEKNNDNKPNKRIIFIIS